MEMMDKKMGEVAEKCMQTPTEIVMVMVVLIDGKLTTMRPKLCLGCMSFNL